MADSENSVQIEKLSLLDDGLDGRVREAFSAYERMDLQFGMSWLSNMAAHALEDHDRSVIYIARLSPDNFIAFPMKLDARNGHICSLGTFYTSNFSPVVCSETPEILFIALFLHLARVEKISTLTLSPMNPDSPLFELIHQSLARAGWKGIHRFFCFGNWTHEMASTSYQSYLESRPSRLKSTITRRTRQFLNADRGQLRIVQNANVLDGAIEQFIAVYNSSWKVKEPYPDFIPQLLRLSAQRGWLRLGIATYDNKPVASQIWLVWEGTAYIFKLAYDKNFRTLSPGTVLTAFMMEHVINKDAVSRIDYLSGDDDYKKDWMSVRKERHGIAAYNPWTLRGRTMLIGHTLKSIVKMLGVRTLPLRYKKYPIDIGKSGPSHSAGDNIDSNSAKTLNL